MINFIKSILVIFILLIGGLLTLVVVVCAQILLFFSTEKAPKHSGRTILLTGGKMTKCLQLARMFHTMGDRVIVAETALYRWCGTRFSNSVDNFIVIPKIEDNGEAYCQSLVSIAQRYNVTHFIPVASPKSAFYDAIAKPMFPDTTKVFHFDEDIVQQLDDKHQFAQLATQFGLAAPESYLIESQDQLLSMAFDGNKKYILKKIEYDPVYRLDLRTIPHAGWKDRVRNLPISPNDTWVLQEYIEGKEICTHTTTIDGNVNLYICCDSSPFQVNYKMLNLPEVEKWVHSFVRQLGATGQISFDFFIKKDGTVIPIECNPRTHSAITLFHNQPEGANAYYKSSKDKTYLPNAESGHTYWLYHELYRMLTCGDFKRLSFLIKRVWTGKEAVFQWNDPWPFWFNNHINIPYQLIENLLNQVSWTRIDFNIGKLVIPDGD